jgi:replicative superfamily II helicase
VNNQVPSNDEMKEIRDQCSRNMSETRGYLLEALERGVGVHHAGLPRKYLSAVERLMRAGSLTVVFGTGTLAFGINMPCRSTVFVGDSVFLTGLFLALNA